MVVNKQLLGIFIFNEGQRLAIYEFLSARCQARNALTGFLQKHFACPSEKNDNIATIK